MDAPAALLGWGATGFLASCLAQQPLPPEHILSLITANRVELKTPLRWHGQLGGEPARLPWDYGYEVDLSGVEYQGALVAVQGGLQLGFTPKPGDPALPEVHAGDEISWCCTYSMVSAA